MAIRSPCFFLLVSSLLFFCPGGKLWKGKKAPCCGPTSPASHANAVSSHRVLCLPHTPNPHLGGGQPSPLKQQAAPPHLLEQGAFSTWSSLPLPTEEVCKGLCMARGACPRSPWFAHPSPITRLSTAGGEGPGSRTLQSSPSGALETIIQTKEALAVRPVPWTSRRRAFPRRGATRADEGQPAREQR